MSESRLVTATDGTVVRFERLVADVDDQEVRVKLVGHQDWRYFGEWQPGGGELFCNRRGSKHLFRVLDAWGFNPFVLELLPGLKTIVVMDEENWRVYKVSYEKFLTTARWFHFKQAGYDKQRFLPLREWDRVDNRPRMPAGAEEAQGGNSGTT